MQPDSSSMRFSNTVMIGRLLSVIWLAVWVSASAVVAASDGRTALRLYVFDGGTIKNIDPMRFRLSRDEVATTDLSVACYLISHPKGVLLWDAGAVPDADWKPIGTTVTHRVVLPDTSLREVSLTRPLLPQLSEAGFAPTDITYIALSHYHWDHSANANTFKNATWLVRKEERDAMFAATPPPLAQPRFYDGLRQSKTTIIDSDEYDVFGDGLVVVKQAGGHTPGHQVLLVKLSKTGPVILSGDLYHFPEARRLRRVTTFDFDQDATATSRRSVEEFITRTGAQLWIQHDYLANRKLRKAPEFYE